MRYCATYDANGKLTAIGTGYGGTEITKEEYDRLLAEIREKVALVNQLYSGEITLDEVPAEWQEEIQRRVEERKAAEEEAEANMPEEAQYAEAGKILMGVTE